MRSELFWANHRFLQASISQCPGKKKVDDDGNDQHIVKKQLYCQKVDRTICAAYNYIASVNNNAVAIWPVTGQGFRNKKKMELVVSWQ